MSKLFGGSKPKASDYEAGPAEKASAAVAQYMGNKYLTQYAPLLIQMRDEGIFEQGVDALMRNRTNADSMQAATNPDNLNMGQLGVTDIENAPGAALAAGLASTNARMRSADNEQKLGVLSSANQGQLDNQANLSRLGQIERTERQSRILEKATVANAKYNAVKGIAMAGIGNLGRNFVASGGKSIMPHVAETNPDTGETSYRKAKGIKEMATVGLGRLFG